METHVISSLISLGYNIDESTLRAAVNEAPKSIEYSRIVNYLTNELRNLSSLDEEVNVITSPDDYISMLMEISSFLKELGCPHESLSQGPLAERLNSPDDKWMLLQFLLGELMASRMLQQEKPEKRIELKVRETPEAFNLLKILKTLRFAKPPENITLKEIFDQVHLRTETAIRERGKELLSDPIWNHEINETQWDRLNSVQSDLHSEYTIRRKMMLQRLDCTIQSFQWSEKMKGKGDLIMNTYSEIRRQLKVEPDVDISKLLSARLDLAIIEKTSNSSVRKNTKSDVNRVLIGKVPDRGGRTSEQAPPPPEMPSWQQRQSGSGGPSRGRGGYQRGGGRGHGQKADNRQSHQYDKRQQYDNTKYNDNRQQNFDSAGTYTSNYHQGSGGGYQRQGNQQYGNTSQEDYYQTEPKRPKTYDSFQNQKTTYADQYVEESQSNRQYQPRSWGRGGGRGNYHRGGYRGGGQNYY